MAKSFIKIPYFLFLLVLFFCLHGSVENYGFLHVNEVIRVFAITSACVALLFLVTFGLTKNLLLASLVSFFISSWWLFFGAIHDLIKATPFLDFLRSYTVLIPVLLVLNIFIIRWIKRNKQLHPKLFLFLNILFLVFCLADVVLLTNRYFNYKEIRVAQAVKFNASKVRQKPNVYFLLFDEYAGYKSLQDSFGFKNDSLYNLLQQQNFKILPGFSNYDFTPYSMSSIFNMQYVPGAYDKQLLAQPDIQQRFAEIRNGEVFAIFRSMGYTINNYSVFDIRDHPALSQSNGLFPIHATLLTNKIFHKRLVKNVGWWFITGKFELPFLKKNILYKVDGYNKKVEEKVLEAASAKQVKPGFYYAHFFLPHGQYFRDSTGAFNRPEQISDLYNKSLYLSYLKYTNTIINGLVKNINAMDPGAIVVIMSDHGFYDYQNKGGYEPYNFDNICFLRLPGAKPDSSNLPRSNVNFFRYLFNTGYGQNLPYVKDSTVFVIEDPAVLR